MSEVNQKGNRFEFDVLVFGSGIAGLTYAIDLLKIRPNSRIALITKKELGESNSIYAQGGIAAVSKLPDSPDSIETHIQDTLQAGDELCNKNIVRKIISNAP